MESTAKLVIILGVVLIVCGAGILLLLRLGIPFGNLPGDIHWQGKNTSVFFPLGTCILLSIVLTVVGNLIIRLINR